MFYFLKSSFFFIKFVYSLIYCKMKKIILSAFLCFSILSSIVAQVDFTNDYTTPSCPDVTINFQYTGDYPDAMFYYWDFGDGIGTDFGINTNISYTYVLSGTFMVDLYVMDFNYNLISFTQSPITILGDAHTITANPYFANINENINFILEGNSTPSTLLWTFGDGTNSNNLNPSHSYSTDGTYTVTAFYESSCGSSETSIEVYISDINFTYNSIDSCPNSNINFQYFGTTPNAFYYWWDFGDGNNSSEMNPVYAYSQPGIYIVNLVVFDDQYNVLGGHTDTVTVLGDVYTLVANPPYTNANTPIQFTLQGEQTPTNVVWDFGDGNSSSELSPTHQFAVSGQYFVSATVTGDCGNIIYTNSVYISDVDYSYTISSNCSPAEVTFQYTGSEIDAFYYTWEFGNNNTSCCDVTSPTTSYTLGGTYTPILTVFDQNWNILGVMSKEIVIGTSLNNEIFVTSCVPYTWNGQTYTESGIYTYNGTSQSLCDSIVNLHLTIQNYLETIQNVNACQSFTWNENGMTYTNSGSYSETYTSVFGCDSIVTLNLNI
jgi:PKD repeat protein